MHSAATVLSDVNCTPASDETARVDNAARPLPPPPRRLCSSVSLRVVRVAGDGELTMTEFETLFGFFQEGSSPPQKCLSSYSLSYSYLHSYAVEPSLRSFSYDVHGSYSMSYSAATAAEVFARFDSNGDESLTLSELLSGLKDESDAPQISESILTCAFDEADTDGDVWLLVCIHADAARNAFRHYRAVRCELHLSVR